MGFFVSLVRILMNRSCFMLILKCSVTFIVKLSYALICDSLPLLLSHFFIYKKSLWYNLTAAVGYYGGTKTFKKTIRRILLFWKCNPFQCIGETVWFHLFFFLRLVSVPFLICEHTRKVSFSLRNVLVEVSNRVKSKHKLQLGFA